MKIINKPSLNTQQGFTLIELVVVIVILGILAATAAPKFIDLTGDARESTIKAVRGSVESATTMVHAKALVGGNTAATGTLDINGTSDVDEDDIALVNGWPASTAEVWNAILELDEKDFTTVIDAANGTVYWYPTQSTAHANVTDIEEAKCYVTYKETINKNIRPAIDVIPDDC